MVEDNNMSVYLAHWIGGKCYLLNKRAVIPLLLLSNSHLLLAWELMNGVVPLSLHGKRQTNSVKVPTWGALNAKGVLLFLIHWACSSFIKCKRNFYKLGSSSSLSFQLVHPISLRNRQLISDLNSLSHVNKSLQHMFFFLVFLCCIIKLRYRLYSNVLVVEILEYWMVNWSGVMYMQIQTSLNLKAYVH